MRPASGGGSASSQARNRWLSEDEGTNEPVAGPSSRPAGSDGERSPKGLSPSGDGDRERKQIRPRPARRAMSSEIVPTRMITPLATPPPPPSIGFNPPEISHLVAAPAQVANAAIAGGSLIPPPSVSIPDFEAGRGGDGIGGVARPSTARREPIPTALPFNPSSETVEERKMREDEILAKLRRILGWYVQQWLG